MPRVDSCERGCARVRYPRAVCRWKIENRQVAMLMAHRRSQSELNVNCNRDCNREAFKWRKFFEIDSRTGDCSPKTCRNERDEHQQPEKSLRDACVKDSDFIFHHGDAKTTKNSLQDHSAKRDHAQIAHPLPIFAKPERHSENDREKSYDGPNQAMSVLK